MGVQFICKAARYTLIAVVLLSAGSARADCKLEPSGSGTVISVIDGDTIELGDGGKVRLIGALSSSGQAKAELERLVLNHPVKLFSGGRGTDRHGRKLAHVYVGEKSIWVQGKMIGAGLARVYSFAGNRACISDLLEIEKRAREDRSGIWGRDDYAIRAAAQTAGLKKHINSFQIVEGLVHQAAKRRKWLFINFAKDWKRDFTVVIPAKAIKRFDQKDLDPARLKGRRIRVRGWITSWNGPMIEADHPEQIEWLD